VGAAADDDDARRICEVALQLPHQSEVPQVVDAEGHLDAVVGEFVLGSRLHARVAHDSMQRWQPGVPECFDEGAHRSQRCEIHLEHGASVGISDPCHRLGTA
jgi:hypothetical protein